MAYNETPTLERLTMPNNYMHNASRARIDISYQTLSTEMSESYAEPVMTPESTKICILMLREIVKNQQMLIDELIANQKPVQKQSFLKKLFRK